MSTLKVKYMRSYTSGVVATAAQLLEGQLFVNYADKKIFGKDQLGNVVQVAAYKTAYDSWSNEYVETNITATAGQTALVAPYLKDYVDVFVKGKLVSYAKVVATDGVNLTLTNALSAGDDVAVISYTKPSGYYRQEFVGTSGASTYTVDRPFYDKKYASVFINGVRQLDTAVTYGLINTFTVNTSVGDSVIFQCFNPFEFTNWDLTEAVAVNTIRYFAGVKYYSQSAIAANVPFAIAKGANNCWHPDPVSGGPVIDPFVGDVVVAVMPVTVQSVTNGLLTTSPPSTVVAAFGKSRVSYDVTQSGFGSIQCFQAAGESYATGIVFCPPDHWKFSDATSGFVTIECWVYPTLITSGTLFDDDTGSLNIGFTNSGVVVLRTPSEQTLIPSGNLVTGAWQHLAFVFDKNANTATGFYNGVKKNTIAAPAINTYFCVGSSLGSTSYYYGYIEGIRVTLNKRYSGNFTPQQVYDTYNAAFAYPKKSHFVSNGEVFYALEDIPANAVFDAAKWTKTQPDGSDDFAEYLSYAGNLDGTTGQLKYPLIFPSGKSYSIGGTTASDQPNMNYTSNKFSNIGFHNTWMYSYSYVNMPTDATTGDFTIEAYVTVQESYGWGYMTNAVILRNVSSAQGDGSIVMNGQASITINGKTHYALKIGVVFGGVMSTVLVTDNIITTSCLHIALVRNAGTLTFWVNGKLKGTDATAMPSALVSYTRLGDSAAIPSNTQDKAMLAAIDQPRYTKAARYTAQFVPWFVSADGITTWKLGNSYTKGQTVYYKGVMYYAQSNIPANTAWSVGTGTNQWSQSSPPNADSSLDSVVFYSPLADGAYSESYPTNNTIVARSGTQPLSVLDATSYAGAGGANFTSGQNLQVVTGKTITAPAGAYTIECMVYISTVASWQSFIANSSTSEMLLTVPSGTSALAVYISGVKIQSANLSTTDWHHMAVCRSATGVLTLFVDGAVVGTYSSGSTAAYNIQIIGNDAFNSQPTNLHMRELRVSNIERYTAAFTSPVGLTFDTYKPGKAYGRGDMVFLGGVRYYAQATIAANSGTFNIARRASNSWHTQHPDAPLASAEVLTFIVPHVDFGAGYNQIGLPIGNYAHIFSNPTAAVTISNDTKYGSRSLYFDGTQNPMTLDIPETSEYAISPNTTGGTIEFWFKTTYTGVSVICAAHSNYSAATIVINNGFIQVYNNGFYQLSDGVADGVWHHGAVVISGSVASCYVDGVKTTYSASTGTCYVYRRIGHSDPNSDTRFRGNLQQLKISNYPKYTANFTPYDLTTDTFASSVAYTRGDIVQRDGLLYSANNAIQAGTPWSAANWTQVTGADPAIKNLVTWFLPESTRSRAFNSTNEKTIASGATVDNGLLHNGLPTLNVTAQVAFTDTTDFLTAGGVDYSSMSFWMYTTTEGNICEVVQDTGSSESFTLRVSGGVLGIYKNGVATGVSISGLSSSTWIYVRTCLSGLNLKLAVNGVSASGGAALNPNIGWPVVSMNKIGASWRGNLQDIRFYSGSSKTTGATPTTVLATFMPSRGYMKNEPCVWNSTIYYAKGVIAAGSNFNASDWSTTINP